MTSKELAARLEEIVAPLRGLQEEHDAKIGRATALLRELDRLRPKPMEAEITLVDGARVVQGNSWPEWKRAARRAAFLAITEWAEENGLGGFESE